MRLSTIRVRLLSGDRAPLVLFGGLAIASVPLLVWFGRGGWCPGQQVTPWVVDVTGEVTPGQDATVSYRGLYRDADPPASSGTIDLISYLVVYQ